MRKRKSSRHDLSSRRIAAGRTRRGGRYAIVAATIIGCAFALLSFTQTQPVLVWNFSPSLPTGLYRMNGADWRVGDTVVLRPDPSIQLAYDTRALPADHLLMKRVAAASGDMVCRSGQDISINGEIVARLVTGGAEQRPSPQWDGCRRLSDQSVFLLGDHPLSLDSRYFGPVNAQAVIGRAVLVFHPPSQNGAP